MIASPPDKTATATELTIGSSGKVAIISEEKEQSCHEETVIKNTGGKSAVAEQAAAAASKSTSKDQVTRSCQTEAVACTETQVSPYTVL